MSTTTDNKDWNTLYGIYHGCHAVDRMTDTVFFSDLLQQRCPVLYESLDKILTERSIDHRLLTKTKEIWCRDYMPIQTDWKRFVFYRYNPDYLQTPHLRKTITDISCVEQMDSLQQGEVKELDLVVDGGNVVKCDDKIIMTEKVFFENKGKSRSEITRLLEEAFQCNILFLPWDRREIFGHSDGIVHYVGDNRVLMTNYSDFDAAVFKKFIRALDNYVEVIPLTYNVKRRHKRSWAYINFLQVGNLVIVPQLGIPEDEQALQQISEAMPRCDVVGVPALEAVRRGGALNCISWNVSTNWWHNGFMGEEYKVHSRPVSWIKARAEKGLAKAQCDLGCCYLYGSGTTKDLEKANDWFRKAAEQNNPQAQFNLGLSYFQGEGFSKDYTKALQLFEQAAAQGEANAQLFVAYCLEELHADKEDILAAYRKAAEMGNADAQCFLGYSYGDGENGLSKEAKESYKWYHEAAMQGNRAAQFRVGLMYEYGIGIKKNKKEAAKWYRRSASKNHTGGLFLSGCCYYYGDGVRTDYRWALRYFRKAAKEGHTGAMYMIGNHYMYGFAVERNLEEAVRWYQKSAVDNFPPAVYMIGCCLYHGCGIREDKAEAMKYIRQAAEDNYAKAVCMLGDCYHNGVVVDKDENKAILYYKRAITLGSRLAEAKLHSILSDYDGRHRTNQDDADNTKDKTF